MAVNISAIWLKNPKNDKWFLHVLSLHENQFSTAYLQENSQEVSYWIKTWCHLFVYNMTHLYTSRKLWWFLHSFIWGKLGKISFFICFFYWRPWQKHSLPKFPPLFAYVNKQENFSHCRNVNSVVAWTQVLTQTLPRLYRITHNFLFNNPCATWSCLVIPRSQAETVILKVANVLMWLRSNTIAEFSPSVFSNENYQDFAIKISGNWQKTQYKWHTVFDSIYHM